ncbi:MAG: succinylglutamate-semialdehyde dehydrogenase [Lentisphaeraceae bacterium]|nr:succinylglutamate-semialdehyde dehydrogenase [Lentisphaeraceae bacterium]
MNSQFIDGKWSEAAGAEFTSSNPANGEILWTGKESDKNDVSLAVDAAKKAFESWRLLSVEERTVHLERYKSLLESRKEEFALLVSKETGKPRWECLTEIGAMIGKLAISLKAYEERCPERVSPAGDAMSVLRFRPIGVMAVYGPFNLPVHLPNGHILPALIAGNTVVFKPSEQTPSSGEFMVKLFEEAGLPDGVVNLVQGSRETGEALADNDDVNGILFTGSYKVGCILHKKYGGRPEKMLALEMGGNNPLIVHDVKDLKASAYLTILSAFITAGQRCVCARRLIVPEGEQGDKFIKCLVDMSSKLSVGDPASDPEPFIGPVISRLSADLVMKAKAQLIKKGAKELLEMKQDGALLSPGILDVSGMKLEDHEVFGPLLQIIRVKNFDAAVDEANNTQFGLSAGLICDDPHKYAKFIRLSNAGIVNWNRQITGAVSTNPFGGSGFSGNYRPSAYFAADYCAYPVASIEINKVEMPSSILPGVKIEE